MSWDWYESGLIQGPVFQTDRITTDNRITLDGPDYALIQMLREYGEKWVRDYKEDVPLPWGRGVTDHLKESKLLAQSKHKFRGFLTTWEPDSADITAYRHYDDGTSYILRGGKAVFVRR